MGIMSAIGTFFGVLFVLLFAVAVTHLLLLELQAGGVRRLTRRRPKQHPPMERSEI